MILNLLTEVAPDVFFDMSVCPTHGRKRGNPILLFSFFLIYCVFEGLTMQLAVRQFDYAPVASLSAGIRLIVHDRESMPFPENTGIYLSPGYNTGVSVEQVGQYEITAESS